MKSAFRALLPFLLTSGLLSQEPPQAIASVAPNANDEIRAVLILSRHGVRATRQ
jgi:hypothetical protein